MPSLRRLLTIAGFGLGTFIIALSLGATPPKDDEGSNEEPTDDEEEVEVQAAQGKSPTGVYDYDAAKKEAFERAREQYNVDLKIPGPWRASSLNPYLQGPVIPSLMPPTVEQAHDRELSVLGEGVEKGPRSAQGEHGTLLQHLSEEVGEHPPMDEEEKRRLEGEELMDELEREKRKEK